MFILNSSVFLRMEDQELLVEVSTSDSAVLDEVETNDDGSLSTDPEAIFEIIEEAFPQQKSIRSYAMPQAMQWLGTRFFALWVWPIVGINKIRLFLKGLDFVKPYADQGTNSYVVKDTETVYTMTSKAFAGEGGIKFFGIRFMAIWVFPMAITGAVMEFLFVGPLQGVNPFS